MKENKIKRKKYKKCCKITKGFQLQQDPNNSGNVINSMNAKNSRDANNSGNPGTEGKSTTAQDLNKEQPKSGHIGKAMIRPRPSTFMYYKFLF